MIRNLRTLLLALVFGIVLGFQSGCQSYDKKTVSGVESSAYLTFNGDLTGTVITLDGMEISGIEPGDANRLQVLPGKHHLRILRDGRVVVDRQVFLGGGLITAIDVP